LIRCAFLGVLDPSIAFAAPERKDEFDIRHSAFDAAVLPRLAGVTQARHDRSSGYLILLLWSVVLISLDYVGEGRRVMAKVLLQ
jgi:hypothetical protein